MEVKVAGKYAIRRKIGSGSFGEIYVGYNLETNEEVAVKLVTINNIIGTTKSKDNATPL